MRRASDSQSAIVRNANQFPQLFCTSFVERVNWTVRTFNRRFTRLCGGFSRRLDNHRHAVALFVAAYNFCKVHGTLGTTPAHGAKITDRPWTVEELIEAATSQKNVL